MTAEEKTILYHFLDTADSWITGKPPEDLDLHYFKDDVHILKNAGQVSHNITHEGISIDSIAAKIAVCERCCLAQTRINTVPGVGSKTPLVLIIGEGPGAEEDARSEPFVGRAGQLLDKMLASISLSRQKNCFIANVVKCRPPQNRDPLPEESQACASFLQAQIQILNPKLLLAVGRVAIQNLLDTKDGIGKLRGKFMDYQGIPLMATYHPSALLRDESLKRPAWEDLKLFRSRLLELADSYEQEFRA